MFNRYQMDKIPAMRREMLDYKTPIPAADIVQVVGAGVVVRAAFFTWDFLSVMRPNSFAVGA